MSEAPSEYLVAQTTEIISAFASSNAVQASDLPALIRSVHGTLRSMAGGEIEQEETPKPAVSIRKSLASREHIVSLIDGRPYKTLKRHIGAHGLTPQEYRARYNLPSDYPMIAPAYSEARSAAAKARGLGRKRASKPPAEASKAGKKAKTARARVSAKTSTHKKPAAARKSPAKGSRSRAKS